MGRVDEALRRVGGQAGPPGAETPGEPEPTPWTFGENDTAHGEIRPQPSPVSQTHRGGLLAPQGRLALFRGFTGAIAERLVVSHNGSSAIAEQFRRLAATLHHAQVAQGLKTVMVTSACAGDGKSLTATNLALTLSESYKRGVLLIDADLRRPSLHAVFQVPNVAGLNEGLKAKDEERLSLIQITETLSLLPAGRPELDPMGGLASTRMKRIIDEASARFDWVIVDTPPLGMLADASIVAGMVPAALLVVRAGVTPFADVQAAVEAIGRERVLGVVLNGVDEPASGSYHYYHRYYRSASVDSAAHPSR